MRFAVGITRSSLSITPYTPRVPDRDRPKIEKDCVDCGLPAGMKLQNAAVTTPVNIPLLYVCIKCGTMMTIPPPRSPITGR
jgi:hypothetical protein